MRPNPIRIAVTRLAAGGDGVGLLDGKVVFVPLAAPGDVAVVEIVHDRGTYLRARLLELAIPSPRREEPRCPLFGTCGGCRWQHLSYPSQLEAKRSIVEDALRRIGRFEPPPVPAPVPSPSVYGYRHRARLHLARIRGRTEFGFYRAASRAVVPAARCPILHRGLDLLFTLLGAAAQRHADLFARCGEVRADTDYEGRLLRLALRTREGAPVEIPGPALGTLRAAAAGSGTHIIGESAAEPLRLGPEAEALETTGEAFTQVNLEQNRNLVRLAMAMAAPAAGEEVLDLYCGIGNLSLPAAARGAIVLGIDLDPEAVRQARENARRLGCGSAVFRQENAAAAARALAGERRRFHLILLNPPRTGARDAVAILPALAPSRILMVSCDPATFARDAAQLREGGYHLAALRPLDLFPQTAHVETVGLFEPRGSAP